MSTLDDLLQKFQQAQQDIYSHLGVSRLLPNGAESEVANLRHKHISGNQDIPTIYPDILDYRGRVSRKVSPPPNYDDEIHVKIQADKDWEPENTIRFNILTIWADREAGAVCAVCNHLPKSDELHFAHSDAIERVKRGVNFYGDSCLLILGPRAK